MREECRYKDQNQNIEIRVEDLLSRMTLEEKAAQLCGNLPSSVITDGELDMEKLREVGKHGHGRFTQYSLVGLVSPEKIASISNRIQRFFIEETRLGIPVALQSENLCGYPAAGGTIFPAMCNLGCAWEPELLETMGEIIGEESKAVGINSAMSPVIDVSRDPRWGRTYETFGEDPYLISQMGLHYVRGMQKKGVSCIAKHFLGYGETQGGLNVAATRINDRELYETFATPFEAADKEAGLDAIMASYSEIDGIPVGSNPVIARKLLRDTMGFQGMLTSDGAAIWKMFDYFHIANSYEEAGFLAKKGGLDTEIPVGNAYKMLPEFVRNGMLSEEYLDESVRRILRIKFKRGLFEHPYVDEKEVFSHMTDKKKKEYSKMLAKKSLVLLKNKDHLLPLDKEKKVAVIGPHGDSLRYPVSGYTYPAYIEMLKASVDQKGSDEITFNGIVDEAKKEKKSSGFNTMYDMFSREDYNRLYDVDDILIQLGASTLQEELGKYYSVIYEKGCEILGEDRSSFSKAVEAAENSDVVVAALGGNCGRVNVTGGEGKDRCHLDLPGVQQELLQEIIKTEKPIILILYGPGIFSITGEEEHVDAVIQAGLPGPYGSKALAEVLEGKYNPGGKLSVTVPRSVGQIPIYYNHKTGSGYNAGIGAEKSLIFSGGYVDESNMPLYPFGYGLSYTQFEIRDVEIPETEISTNGTVEIDCTVENVGKVRGDEVVQLYYHFRNAHVIRPVMQLVGFKRVTLESGEKKKIHFSLKTAQLGYYNEEMEFVVELGKADIFLGTSSVDLPFCKEIVLTGKKNPVMGKRIYTCPVTVK